MLHGLIQQSEGYGAPLNVVRNEGKTIIPPLKKMSTEWVCSGMKSSDHLLYIGN
jgi:hypothetical protein